MTNNNIFEVEYLSEFDKEVSRFIRKKKFRSLPDQVEELVKQAERGEFDGDKIMHKDFPTPHDIYKLRLPNPDANVGKSNGYRVIYMVLTETKIVVLLTIYYKKEQETIPDIYIDALTDGYFLALMLSEE